MNITSDNNIFFFQEILFYHEKRPIFSRFKIEQGHLTSIVLSFQPEKSLKTGKSALGNRLIDLMLGKRPLSDLGIPVRLTGTTFQLRIFDFCRKIPPGKTITYGELAEMAGCNSPRAVGQALKRNPLPIIIPCHRVVGANGNLTGFSCGLEIKKSLIEFERQALKNENSSDERQP